MIKEGLLAFSLESSALALVLTQAPAWPVVLSFIVLHGGASVLGALVLRFFLPPAFRVPRLPVIALFGGFLFFVPFLALVAALAALVTGRFLPARYRTQIDFATMEAVVFETMRDRGQASAEAPHRGYGEGGLRGRLASPHAALEERMRTLLALQAMPGRITSILLREELRLFKQLPPGDAHALAARHLAELYWELIYQGLATGDLRRFAARESLRYADAALAHHGDDAGVHFLRGRVLHALGRSDEAWSAFDQAVVLGLSESKVLPYLAEIAFQRREYAQVRQLFAQLGGRHVPQSLAPLVGYWS
ncbi:MAG: hypothetical protein ACOZAH_01025 [Pseudomonadota bacterium]